MKESRYVWNGNGRWDRCVDAKDEYRVMNECKMIICNESDVVLELRMWICKIRMIK